MSGRKPRVFTPDVVDEAARLWAEGGTARDIAKRLGVNVTSFDNFRRAHRDRFPMRSAGARPRVFSLAKKKRIAAIWAQGGTRAAVASEAGVSLQRLDRMVRDDAALFPPRVDHVPDDVLNRLANWWKIGVTLPDMAARIGLPYSTVTSYRTRYPDRFPDRKNPSHRPGFRGAPRPDMAARAAPVPAAIKRDLQNRLKAMDCGGVDGGTGVAFADLPAHGCRWPLRGDGAAMMCCGQARASAPGPNGQAMTGPYCPAHTQQATGTGTRGERRAAPFGRRVFSRNEQSA